MEKIIPTALIALIVVFTAPVIIRAGMVDPRGGFQPMATGAGMEDTKDRVLWLRYNKLEICFYYGPTGATYGPPDNARWFAILHKHHDDWGFSYRTTMYRFKFHGWNYSASVRWPSGDPPLRHAYNLEN